MKKKIIKEKGDLPNFLIGISSQHYDFQVVWTINNVLKKKLSKTKSISIRLNKDAPFETHSFSLFSDFDLDGNYFYLFSNKEEGAILYPKFKNIDYFFIVKSEGIQLEDVVKRISASDFIFGSFIIPVNKVFHKIIERISEN